MLWIHWHLCSLNKKCLVAYMIYVLVTVYIMLGICNVAMLVYMLCLVSIM